jgi:hypothetical protein
VHELPHQKVVERPVDEIEQNYFRQMDCTVHTSAKTQTTTHLSQKKKKERNYAMVNNGTVRWSNFDRRDSGPKKEGFLAKYRGDLLRTTS